MRILVVVVLGLVGCVAEPPTAPVCDADDVDCFADHLAFVDASGNVSTAVLVDSMVVATLQAATSTSTSVPVLTSGPPSYLYPDGTVIGGYVLLAPDMNLSFTDPNGCRPTIGFTVLHGATRSKHTGCFPGLHDMKMSGTILDGIGFQASAAVDESFDFEIAAISSTNCDSIDDPAGLIASASAVANNDVTIPLTISPPPATGGGGSGGGSCPGGLLASTLECDPLGSSGAASTCIPDSDFTEAGVPVPAACAPAGTTGCENSNGTLVAPCCPGLTCTVGASCGDATNAAGGTCK
ncbi:MAG TPA: hypothetical protein VGG74_33805 [Kofleriaceae bacterium]|jgi:hypothetical protein